MMMSRRSCIFSMKKKIVFHAMILCEFNPCWITLEYHYNNPLTYISFCNPFHWIYFSRSMPFLCVNFWGFNFSHFKVHIFIRLRFYGLFVFNVNVDSMNVWKYTENVVAKIKLVRKRTRPHRKEFLPVDIALRWSDIDSSEILVYGNFSIIQCIHSYM